MSTANLSRTGLVSLALGLTALFVAWVPACAAGEVLRASAPWIPSADVSFALRVDALSVTFALIVCGTGALVAAYAASYVEREAAGRFYAYLTLFMLSMLGVVLADDLLLLYVSWELTSLCSFFLIGFERERPAARAAARHALLVTVLGGLCLLAGLLLLSIAADTTRLTELLERGEAVRGHALYLPALALVAVGAFTKSAQVPFHSWLPRAMEAPTPASAYLHAATMVKAGVYLLARLSPVLGGTAAWTGLLLSVGVATMVLGAARALGETHLKRTLAYSTVCALGMLVAFLGVGTQKAVLAALAYLVAHALYKGGLFLYAGAITHSTGIHDVTHLRGLLRSMPKTAVAGALAAASLAGVPPLLGFLGKDLLYGAALSGGGGAWRVAGLSAVTFVANALLVAVALVVGGRPLLGSRAAAPRRAHEPSPWLWGPPLVLGLAGLAAGAAPGVLAPLLTRAASEVAGGPIADAAMMPHLGSTAWWLGLATLAAGAILFAARGLLRRAGSALARALRLQPAAGYERTLGALAHVAEWNTRLLQTGMLRRYVAFTVLATAGLLTIGFVRDPLELAQHWAPTDASPADVVVALSVLLAVAVAIGARSRFAAIAAMNVVGLTLGLLYFRLGAPDLAMTQFVVEVLNAVVFVLAFYHLPHFERLSSRGSRLRDAVLAGGLGTVMAAVVLASTHEPTDRVSELFVRASVEAGHGRNIVNVILTDFRSVDTLGEITVLATAAFGVVALLRLRLQRQKAGSA
jgi:multicomponent Na+:H+ antiporter subunit A